MWRWSYHHDLDRLNGYSDIKKMVTVTSLYVFVGNAKKQKQKKLRGQPLLFPSKKKNEKVFHYKYDTGDYMIHNKLIPMWFSVRT